MATTTTSSMTEKQYINWVCRVVHPLLAGEQEISPELISMYVTARDIATLHGDGEIANSLHTRVMERVLSLLEDHKEIPTWAKNLISPILN